MNSILRQEKTIKSRLIPPQKQESSPNSSRYPSNPQSEFRKLFPNRTSYGPLIAPVNDSGSPMVVSSSCNDIPKRNDGTPPQRQEAKPRSNLSALLDQQPVLEEGKNIVSDNSTENDSNKYGFQTKTRRCYSSKELGTLAPPSGSPYAFMLYQKEKIEVRMAERLKQTRESNLSTSTSPPHSSCSPQQGSGPMTNKARNQRRAEHTRAVTNELCEIVSDLFISESKLLNPSQYGVDSAFQREQVLRCVERFVGSLPPRYALMADTPSEVLLHMRLIAAVRSDPKRAVVHITSLENDNHWTQHTEVGRSKKLVTIACSDTIGLLEYVSKLLGTGGSRVLDADVMLSSDNVALDRFVVEMNGRLRLDKLSQCIENFLEERTRKKEKKQFQNDGPTLSRSSSIKSNGSTSLLPVELSATVYYSPSPAKSISNAKDVHDEEMKAAIPLSEVLASGSTVGALPSLGRKSNSFLPLSRNNSLPPIPLSSAEKLDIAQFVQVQRANSAEEASPKNDEGRGITREENVGSSADNNQAQSSMRQRRPLVNRDARSNFDVEEEDILLNDGLGVEDDAEPDTAIDYMTYDLSSGTDRVIPLIPFDELMLIETLGMGRVSTIYRAAWRQTSSITHAVDVSGSSYMLALKVAMVNAGTHDTSHVDELRREADIAARLKHPNICDLLGVAADSECFCLAYEFCESGSLLSLLSDSTRYYEYLPIALDIANGMAYLHSRNVIHRDLKPSNILLTGDHRAKISDFGMSVANTGQELTAETGTYRYMAPEVIRHESYSSNADVYSFGVCLWQLITREVPFASMTPIQAAYSVAEGRRPIIPDSTPSRLKEIICACWDQDAGRRPSFTYIAMALADYAKMAFSPANVGAQTLQIANEMLANVEGNSTVNVDFTIAPVNVIGAYMDNSLSSLPSGNNIGLEI